MKYSACTSVFVSLLVLATLSFNTGEAAPNWDLETLLNAVLEHEDEALVMDRTSNTPSGIEVRYSDSPDGN